MSQPTYRVTCLIDKLTVLPVVLDPLSAPWFCMGCRHSWWAAELGETARKQFRPSVCDFGYGQPLADLQSVVQAELAEAVSRGTSCREDMLELLPERGLRRVGGDSRVRSDFITLVAGELMRRGFTS